MSRLGPRGDPNPTWPVQGAPTFGPCEEQLVRGVQTEDRLGVALGHGDTLQRGCARTLGPSDRGDDAPSGRERRGCAHQPGRLGSAEGHVGRGCRALGQRLWRGQPSATKVWGCAVGAGLPHGDLPAALLRGLALHLRRSWEGKALPSGVPI